MVLFLAWIKCWWHCLTHFHRMAHAEYSDFGMHNYSETTWVGCGDCDTTFYGTKPKGFPK